MKTTQIIHSNLHLFLHFRWTILNIAIYRSMNRTAMHRDIILSWCIWWTLCRYPALTTRQKQKSAAIHTSRTYNMWHKNMSLSKTSIKLSHKNTKSHCTQTLTVPLTWLSTALESSHVRHTEPRPAVSSAVWLLRTRTELKAHVSVNQMTPGGSAVSNLSRSKFTSRSAEKPTNRVNSQIFQMESVWTSGTVTGWYR